MIAHGRAGRPVVICLDEAQTIPLPSLEILRLLSNLETEKSKLMQLVLFGQPELDRKLAKESVRQLRQRIGFSYRMRAMTEIEAAAYPRAPHAHRWSSGCARVFAPQAAAALHMASDGVPRLLNIMANKALMVAQRRVAGRRPRGLACRARHRGRPQPAPVRAAQLGWHARDGCRQGAELKRGNQGAPT